MVQEAMGLKGGYIRNNNQMTTGHYDTTLATMDVYGITAILINGDKYNYAPINIPESIYKNIENPMQRIHASAVTIDTGRKIRNGDKIILLNLYRSSNAKDGHNEQLQAIINHLHNFMNDKNPNIIIAGDLNIWSEMIGSDPEMRITRPRKFIIGDEIIELFANNRIININNGQPNMWMYDENDIMKYYHVDTIWTNNELINITTIHHQFNTENKITNHFPNHITVQHVGRSQTNKIPGHVWNINEVSTESWNKYRDAINQQMNILNNIINDKVTNKINNNDVIMETAYNMICKIIYNAAVQYVGKKTIYDINKPYIDKSIITMIRNLRNQKKGIITKIMNRIKKQKLSTNFCITSKQIEIDIISIHGKTAYTKYMNWKIRNKEKNKIIRNARRKYQNNKINKLITKYKDRFYYRIIDDIMNVGYNKNSNIPNIIKPSVAVNIKDVDNTKLKHHHYTRNSFETSNEFNQYFNTIGNKKNPNYKSTLKTHESAISEI